MCMLNGGLIKSPNVDLKPLGRIKETWLKFDSLKW